MDKIFKIKKKQDGRYSSGLYKIVVPPMFGCPLYIHNIKKTCFVRVKGCPYAPYIWMPPYVWMPPICWDAPVCLDACYVWMAPCILDAPIWLPVCLDNPICLDAPVCIGIPYVWMPPICLDTPHMFRCPCTYTTQRKHALSD